MSTDFAALSMIIIIPIGVIVVIFVISFIRGYLRGGKKTAPKSAPAKSKTGSSGKVKTAVPTATTKALNIFISYRREDSADITGRIYDRLVQHFNRDAVFKDVDSIPLGVDFREHIERYVGRCQVLLAVIGPSWVDAVDGQGYRRLDNPQDFVRIEIGAALSRGIPVIPLLVRGARMPATDVLPKDLQNLAYHNGIPVRPDPDFHNDINRLINGLEEHASRPVSKEYQ